MFDFAHQVLHALGAVHVRNVIEGTDPTNEEEFLKIEYVSPTPITWEQYCKARPDVERNRGLKRLRYERTLRLQKCDWVMTLDNIDTLANKQEWIAYRQALRDLPNNPPAFVWKNGEPDFSKMNMPVEPPVIRIPPS
jgi:hypothetical protein